MSPAEKIIAYLAGKKPLKTFYAEAMRDKELQSYLEQDVSIRPYTDDGSVFLYIACQDPAEAGTDLNLRDLLSKLLTLQGIAHEVDEAAARDYELALDAAPSWLVLPDEYLAGLLEKLPKGLARSARRKLAREAIAEDFRYLKKPPKWLQDAKWPFADGKPLLFVGQLDLADLLHDDAQVYVFLDTRDQSIVTLTQSA
jgi:hypothetical protein